MKDVIDVWIKSVNWKIGGFSMLPIFFGVLMACVDNVMMSSIKMVNIGTMSPWGGTSVAVAFYVLQPLIFLRALNYEGMAVTNLIWNLVSNITVTLQGVLVFGESIKGVRWLGIAMSLVSLALLAYSDD